MPEKKTVMYKVRRMEGIITVRARVLPNNQKLDSYKVSVELSFDLALSGFVGLSSAEGDFTGDEQR
jgi:hypothetical protein